MKKVNKYIELWSVYLTLEKLELWKRKNKLNIFKTPLLEIIHNKIVSLNIINKNILLKHIYKLIDIYFQYKIKILYKKK